ncbi:hypothetical protein LEP1GSC132_0104 [Leptospira kirschneri str. 200803703]|nr:hypothetical protein [Leptospira kirschneri]EKP07056.1 hypothetical protein LEP1GSC018_1203 [Leptospira kirschneri str. 2008720114]EMN26622.1 hypothetical protein LEP1GSC065_2680 [Leptospira kirschneri serovar Sokoine str. RM1]EMO65836.1 hypothetical protein LEP1GSC132_0104 [Leptospira kirschneri str. 200803703]EMO79988.1 hypothetical protein LEP1GSC126_1051 [Leptospira kirschneri str. 200801774]EPG49914.1 hypothetical protein LEP1GSC049_3135 [Leptospira kirschneri serovar Cynopteri str. 35
MTRTKEPVQLPVASRIRPISPDKNTFCAIDDFRDKSFPSETS